jgi:hypothetical protein
MPGVKKEDIIPIEKLTQVYQKHAGNISATARELGVTRESVRKRVRKAGLHKKPLAAGSVTGLEAESAKLPTKGAIKRYILTSAQNNTHINKEVWESLQALADHYEAKIFVGTYSYNQNAYGEMAVKRGKKAQHERKLWYDPIIEPFIKDDRIELAPGLVWCGEMNILPTAPDPLSGLESYSGRKSAIFPHAKLAMRSIPTMQSEGTKLNYTTGTVTQRNYIQKRAGLVAEHHHVYGGLIVEVNHHGNWWVRQLNTDNDGTLYDLDLKVQNGKVTKTASVEAITWGDLHATYIDETTRQQAQDMIDALKPNFQFMHDILEGVSVNHHKWNDPHARFKDHLRGLDNFTNELTQTKALLEEYKRTSCKMVVVYSNHDTPWVLRWLREHDYRRDPQNAVLFLNTQLAVYKSIESNDERFNPLENLLRSLGLKEVEFLQRDESYTICDKRIECGMHGHLGPNGSRGNPQKLAAMGRKSNTAHTHSAGIYNGLYVAGTSTKLRWDYAQGPSSWTHSHIVTYPNGKRAIITVYNGAWRAV